MAGAPFDGTDFDNLSPMAPVGMEPEALDMQRRVLVVEDEATSRRALTALLRASGYDATAAGSAEEALDVLKGRDPQIMLVDLDLPGMNGLEFIAIVSSRRPDIRSVLVTATSRERLESYIRTHPMKYIRKPIDMDVLLGMMGPAALTH